MVVLIIMIVCFVAVAGTTSPSTVARHTGTGARRATGTTSWASDSSYPRLQNLKEINLQLSLSSKKVINLMNETENNGRIDDKDRVFRGGSWYNHSIYCRAALRDRDAPGFRSVDLGLRLVVPTPRNKE